MPTYEYRCPRCESIVELVQSISQRVAPKCDGERCDSAQMETVIGRTSFVLHGSGWAKDGYGSKR